MITEFTYEDMTLAVEVTPDGVAVELDGDGGTYSVRRDDHDLLAALSEVMISYGWTVVS